LSRFRPLSAREVCRILTEHGFVKVRQKGSHIGMQRRSGGTTFTVTVPNHREIRVGTLQSIIRQSGLPRSAFEME
jgi:predicted RNA binding protein YcfA (HicA-like mRNA interferase family)